MFLHASVDMPLNVWGISNVLAWLQCLCVVFVHDVMYMRFRMYCVPVVFVDHFVHSKWYIPLRGKYFFGSLHTLFQLVRVINNIDSINFLIKLLAQLAAASATDHNIGRSRRNANQNDVRNDDNEE